MGGKYLESAHCRIQMIPADKYDQGRANDLLWYLIQEIRRTMADRGELEADWLRYEAIYRARPVAPTKDFPFKNASNLVIPVAATDIDTLFSRMMGLLLEPPNLWSITAKRPEFKELAAATEDFMEWAQHNELDIHGPIGDWIVELHKLGTSVLKQRYTREMKKVYEWRELDNGQTWQQQAVIMLQDKPAIHHVRLHDFYIPPGFKNEKVAPWVAERVRLTWQQYMNRVKAGIYIGAERVGASYYSPPINNVQQELDRLSRYRASINKQLEFYEFWLDYDIDGDGWDEALVCTIHLASQTYVRLDFNPFFNQDKPYSSARFMRDVNSFYGIGLGEMLDHFQEEVTAMHNQRIDSGTIGNSLMLKIRKDETSIKIDQPIYPGKQFRVSNMDSIAPIEFGNSQTAPSIEMEQATRAEGARRTGVNDWVQAQAGPEQAYGTAYTTQQMILASSKRFGETLREIRVALGETGTRVLELYQQYNSRGKEYMALGQTDGDLVKLMLHFPVDLIRRGLLVGVTAIDTQTSRDTQIRTTTLLMQQLMQFYAGYMNALSTATNPMVPPPVKQAAMAMAQGSAVLMEKLLHLYGEQDTAEILPMMQGALHAQQQQLVTLLSPSAGQQQPPQPFAGGGGVPGGPPQAAGMAGIQPPYPEPPGGFGIGSAPPVIGLPGTDTRPRGTGYA